jgi:hypothetical protein
MKTNKKTLTDIITAWMKRKTHKNWIRLQKFSAKTSSVK